MLSCQCPGLDPILEQHREVGVVGDGRAGCGGRGGGGVVMYNIVVRVQVFLLYQFTAPLGIPARGTLKLLPYHKSVFLTLI